MEPADHPGTAGYRGSAGRLVCTERAAAAQDGAKLAVGVDGVLSVWVRDPGCGHGVVDRALRVPPVQRVHVSATDVVDPGATAAGAGLTGAFVVAIDSTSWPGQMGAGCGLGRPAQPCRCVVAAPGGHHSVVPIQLLRSVSIAAVRHHRRYVVGAHHIRSLFPGHGSAVCDSDLVHRPLADPADQPWPNVRHLRGDATARVHRCCPDDGA
ncbi:Uncharacterised protein [Mycobacteroides abscessus subsp. abscessus]|nr:Uncharacterised protein [Mycobacteroides abscessus subsp. abscessus]